MAFAKKYVLEHGPIILEMDTYRYHGHSMSDPGSTYRTRDEISSMRQLRDPVEHVRKLLLEKAGADPAELKKIEKVGVSLCQSCSYLQTLHVRLALPPYRQVLLVHASAQNMPHCSIHACMHVSLSSLRLILAGKVDICPLKDKCRVSQSHITPLE